MSDIKGFDQISKDKFRARITVKGKLICLGDFPTQELARAAYKKASLEIRGKYGLIINIEGLRFGKLTVVDYAGVSKSGKRHKWLCKCDCGNHHVVQQGNLISGGVKSCGCARYNHLKLPTEEASFNRVFRYYKTNAIRKNQLFDLSKDQFRQICTQKCHYCGSEPKDFFKRQNDNGHFFFNGIDRKTNHEGYTLSNSLPCCRICNRAKSDMAYGDFIQYIERIKTHE